jgi:UDP-N-acetylglucosamine--N-acetylmuramyl-(pentapeptide) pyrophosphoryl-undecaprenol N-acetylglucosamine transferase
MKLIVSGGGTGGHIYPAIALIEEFKKRDLKIDILYVGTENGLESKLIPELGIDYRAIRVKGMPRRLNKSSLIALRELFVGLRQSKQLIREYKPDLVVGTGGFVSGPILYAAAKKTRTLIHEQNSYPGVTNRILSRFVDVVAITFRDSEKFFKKASRLVLTGNPIRSDFRSEPLETDYEFFQLTPERPIVFCFGGSNGSSSLNRVMTGLIPKLSSEGIQTIHVTGPNHFDSFKSALGEDYDDSNARIYPYMKAMASAYAVADLVITSSGAITLAEISSVSLPAVLIPKAYTTENHQEFNARSYVEAGAAEMILEKDLSVDFLYDKIRNLVYNKEKLKMMGENSKKMTNPSAAKEIVDLAYTLLA